MTETEKEVQSVVICLPTKQGNPGRRDDNIYGKCAWCEEPIQWRPHMNAIGIKVCTPCAMKRIDKDNIASIGVTKQTQQELLQDGISVPDSFVIPIPTKH